MTFSVISYGFYSSASQGMWNKGETVKKQRSKTESIKILLIDDNRFFLESLSFILNMKKDMEVIETSDTARGAFELIEQSKPDVVILDLMLPDMDGITLLEKIKEKYPDLSVIILTMHEGYQKQALHRGAFAYHVKGEPLDTLYDNIRRACPSWPERSGS